jgi:hypothetical protein
MAVVLMGIWTGHFLGGFALQDDPQHQFNWHPLLMTIGLIFLYGNGENKTQYIFYRRNHPRNHLKDVNYFKVTFRTALPL